MKPDILFQPFQLKSLHMRNRIVMAPMTRSFSPAGIPGDNVAAYYTKRAAAEVGLILSEGTVIDRPSSSNDPNVPHFYGEEALAGWKNVIDGVHQAGGQMGPQIWHMGVMDNHASGWVPPHPFEGPSEYTRPGVANGRAMSDSDIADTITAFGRAAADAQRLGFDCVELHGAHGYLIDQFFWEGTNKRSDTYGGKNIAERSKFAADVIREVRRQVRDELALIIRLSQWKSGHFTHKLAASPQELESWLTPLADAGIDIFHCSQRRFWEAEFEGDDLNFAGWVKKVSGKPTITVGSVGLSGEFIAGFQGETSKPDSIDELLRRFDRGDFDLVAVGRPLIANPDWVQKVRDGRDAELKGFSRELLSELK
jgi:2,4-dienoyl-CoA reductase-like NADH-dependent reductase (Old Yellow Enzyme family)